jgi:hypothetical protein
VKTVSLLIVMVLIAVAAGLFSINGDHSAGGATARIDKSAAYVGEPLKLVLGIRTNAGENTRFPEEVPGFAVLKADTGSSVSGGQRKSRAEYTVVARVAGEHLIGPLKIGVSGDGGKTWRDVAVPELSVRITARLSADIGEKKKVTISGNMAGGSGVTGGSPGFMGGQDGGGGQTRMVDVPVSLKIEEDLGAKKYFSPRAALRLFAGILGLAAAIWVFLKARALFLSNRKAPEAHPAEKALMLIEQLKKDIPPGKNDREYCSRLYRAFADFIKWRFSLGGAEMTADELASLMEKQSVAAEKRAFAVEVITMCEDIKYAGANAVSKPGRVPDADAVISFIKELKGE